MKKLPLLLFLFFIQCSSQEKVTDKKYMDMETTFQKYRDIKARYDSLVEKNKQNLVYQNGTYFKKTLYNKEVREKRYIPEESASKFILEEGDKAYFVKNNAQHFELYTLQGNKVLEQASVLKNNNMVYLINNFTEGTIVRYRNEGDLEYMIHYVEDKSDPNKRDIMLRQEFINNKLAIEKNYKKDFEISKEQMLKKLADNFYHHSVSYLGSIDFRIEFNKENDVKKAVQETLQPLKKKIEIAIETKNDYYKEIGISKNYNQDGQPVYDVTIPDHFVGYWELKIDGKTNKVIEIKLSIPVE
ncbi:hypothetical protein J8J42_02415 [Chryseobacterium sp. cx-311]|uniref:hypothetical protein n=1 Tax=Marnyiella aurantia TaxID=2758037 RepID=UPI001AE54F0C|nr:hypothetical protein [Marnyiella aurantia]MBP0611897.1 hypothetical protein [Marnyiella aurantia]